MTITTRTMSVDSFAPMLKSLIAILEKGAEHERTTSADLANARLAPDMYTLAEQVRTACLQAEGCIARLTGATAPARENAEATIADLKGRLALAIAYLESADARAFEGAEDRDCSVHTPNGFVFEMNGAEFLRSWALPHFYFHVVTAYDILRHHGVALGKRDYLAQARAFIRPSG
jgi:hypothetical protein